MLGSTFHSRYRVAATLRECALYGTYELRDLLGDQRALLFRYPLEGRPPLDLSGFRYRQRRLAELCGPRVPSSRLGQTEDAFYVLVEIDEDAASLGLPLADDALEALLGAVVGDVCSARAGGTRLYQLSPDLIWRDGRGRPFYLPPLYLHFPGFFDRDDPELGPWAALSAEPELALDLDLFGLARLTERFAAGKPAWQGFRRVARTALGEPGVPGELDFDALIAALPIDPPGTCGRRGAAPAELGAEARLSLEAWLRDFRNGDDLWIDVAGEGSTALLGALRRGLAGAGFGVEAAGWVEGAEAAAGRSPLVRIDDLRRPETLLDPIWAGAGDGSALPRLLALVDARGFGRHGALSRRAAELLEERPRLRRFDLEAGAAGPDDALDAGPEERQLLEVLALQPAPLPLGLLGELYPQEEAGFFSLLADLDERGCLRWRPGRDPGRGTWGLRIELADPGLRERIRAGLEPGRRRQLHRLCAELLPAGERVPPLSALHRLYHLDGAEASAELAREGLALFRRLQGERNPLVLEHLVDLLRAPAVEAQLDLAGKRAIYTEQGRGLIRSGELDAASELFERGLASLTGNPGFLPQLLAEGRERPEVEGLGDPELLPAVSALLRELAEIGETRGEFAAAIRLLGSLLDSFSEELSAYERGLILNEQAWLHYRMGQHERAVERCEVALRLFDSARHQGELGQTYNTLGAAQWALNRWTEAEAYYKRALMLREHAGDENRVAASLNNLGNLYRLTERYALAIDHFNRSMAIKKRQKNYAGYLASLYNVALISFELNDYKAARSQGQECLELNRLVGNIQLGAEVQGLLGEIDQVEGRAVEAAEHLRAAIDTCREIDADTELTTMLRRMIPVQLALEDLPGASASITEGLRMARRTGNRLEEARIQVYAADHQLRRGDRAEAIVALESAADRYALLDRHEELARLYSRLGLLQLDGGDERRARAALKQATAIIEHRKLNTVIAEWDSLQLRLQQRLSHFVDRIESDGKLRLASLYQILALLAGEEGRGEAIASACQLLREALGYGRVLIGLVTESGCDWLGEGGESPGAAAEEQLRGGGESGELRLFVAESRGEPRHWALQPFAQPRGGLLVERNASEVDDEERDFLQGLARLVATRLGARAGSAPAGVAPAQRRGGRAARSDAEAPRLIGSGRDMQRLRKLIERVRDVESTVLITGESGTGKEEVARALHYESGRRNLPFLAVNCASIPDTLLESTLFGHERGAFTGALRRHAGVFEEAAGGTVLLDEIGEMGADMQAKLLRVLQSKEFTRVGGTQVLRSDVRILTATNRDLEAEVKRGRFREDLFYRINVLRIRLAPLREKREDIAPLAEFFLAQSGEGKRLSPEVADLFQRHPWPGNIRQLQNVISSCVVLSRSPIIQMEDLPEQFLDLRESPQAYQSLDELAALIVASGDYSAENPLEDYLLAALASQLVERVGNKTEAAKLLGISKPTLYRRLRLYDTIRRDGSPQG